MVAKRRKLTRGTLSRREYKLHGLLVLIKTWKVDVQKFKKSYVQYVHMIIPQHKPVWKAIKINDLSNL